MASNRIRTAVIGLQWTLGTVVLAESSRFVLSTSAAHAFAKTGLPNGLRIMLGSAEILAALLFLIPRTSVKGGVFLVVIFALASVVHVLHGWFDIGGLVVYAAAALAVIAYRADLSASDRSRA
jgi:DoxX-like family